MIEFTYQAINESEVVTTGTLAAESVSAAVMQLESQGLRVLSIEQQAAGRPQGAAKQSALQAKLTSADRQLLQRRVAEVLEKRALLAPALAALAAELPPGRTRRQLQHLVTKIDQGATAEAICEAGSLSTLWLLLLGRGASTPQVLESLLDEATLEHESRTSWSPALLYPAMVFLGSLAVLVFLCVNLVPVFAEIYRDFNLDLPTLTYHLISLSNKILRSPAGFTLGVLALPVCLYMAFRLLGAWGILDRVAGRFFKGSSGQVTAMARFTRWLAEALDTGLSLPSALQLAAEAGGRGTLHRAAYRLADAASQENFQLSQSATALCLPATVLHALQAGSGGAPSIALLRKLSELYSTRVRSRHAWSHSYLYPLAIFVVGVMVGMVVLALFVPMVGLVNGLTG